MTRRQKAIAIIITFCVVLVAAAISLNVSWILINARRDALLILGMVLFALMCGVFANSATSALAWTDSIRQSEGAIERDTRSGVGPCELAATHMGSFFYVDTPTTRDTVVAGLRTLHRASAGPLRHLRDDRPEEACKWQG